MLFTFALVVVGALQVAIIFHTLKANRLAAEAAKKAADAAKQSAEIATRSAEAIPNIERAYIFVTVSFCEEFLKEHGSTEFAAEITIANRGKTPAILLDCSHIAKIVGLDDQLPEISGIDADKPWIPSGTVTIGADHERIEHAIIPTYAEQMNSVKTQTERLVCYGVIRYEDVFCGVHETGFCWEYQHRLHDFYPAKDHKRNYRK